MKTNCVLLLCLKKVGSPTWKISSLTKPTETATQGYKMLKKSDYSEPEYGYLNLLEVTSLSKGSKITAH